MSRSNFENLKVFQLAERLSDAIWNIVLKWSAFPQRTMGAQLVDAADSIGANIAEGTGQGTFNSNRRFVRIARGSLNETKYWLRRAYQRKLLTPAHVDELRPMTDELAPRLNAYLRSIGPRPPRTTDNGQRTNA